MFDAAHNQSYAISTHELEEVQFGIDHKAILWCNQLVKTVAKGLHSWATLPTNQRNVSFWANYLTTSQMNGTAATTTTTDTRETTGLTDLLQAERVASASAARLERIQHAMGVIGGSVFISAVDYAPLVLMSFTSIGGWAIGRVILSQLLKLPAEFAPELLSLIPDLSSIFYWWILGPIAASLMLPPPLAKHLLASDAKQAGSRRSSALQTAGIFATAVAVEIGRAHV